MLRPTADLLRWQNLSVFVGALPPVARHRHRAPALLIAVDAPIRLCCGSGWQPIVAAWVPAGVPHAIDSQGGRLAALYFDPLDNVGRHGSTLTCLGFEETGWARQAQQQVQQLIERIDCSRQQQAFAAAVVQAVLPRLGISMPGPTADVRLLALRERLEEGSAWRYSLPEAARDVGLSPGRFSHLFQEATGLGWAAYRNWFRLIAACTDLARRPRSLTALAADFRYASPAHFSAAFRQAFGLQPSALAEQHLRLHHHPYPSAGF